MNKKIFLIIRIVLTALILFVIFLKIDIKELIRIYREINLNFLILALFFYYLAFVFLSIRWKILLLEYRKKFSLFEILKVYLLGMLINTISPATLGVDILRSVLISKKIEKGKAFSFASVLVDRLMGLVGIFSFVPVSVIILKGVPEPYKILTIFLIFSLFIIFSLIFTWTEFFEKIFKKIINRITFFNLNEKLLNFYNSYKLYSNKKIELIFSYFLTLLLQSSFAIQAYFCSLSLGLKIPFYVFIFLVPLINSLNFVPITISGIGIREAGFYVLFSGYFSAEKAISISLLYFLTGVVGNLPFAYYLFKNPLKDEK